MPEVRRAIGRDENHEHRRQVLSSGVREGMVMETFVAYIAREIDKFAAENGSTGHRILSSKWAR